MNSYRMTAPDCVAVLVDMIEAANYDSGRNKILEGSRNMKVGPKGETPLPCKARHLVDCHSPNSRDGGV